MASTIKLIDIIVQLIVIVTSLSFLILYQTEGYFFWSILFLLGWIILSSILHLILRFKTGLFRIIIWVLFLIVGIGIFIYSFNGGTIAQVNGLILPSGLILVILYAILTITELQESKIKGEEFLNF